MNRRRPPLALGALASLSIIGAALVWGCATGGSEETSDVRDVIRTNFPSWTLVGRKDLTREQAAQWTAQHPGQDPAQTMGNYFGDGRKCYAMLLTKKDTRGRRARLVVLAPTPSGRYETYVLFSESPVDTLPVIETSKGGEYQVFLDGQSMTVPTEGVVYSRPDGRQKLFFWNVDRFSDIELTAQAQP